MNWLVGLAKAQHRRQTMAALYDNFHGRCFWCRKPISRRKATRDHVVPKSKGGADDITNYVLACQPCNGARGNMDAEEWLRIVTAKEKAA